MEVHIGAITFAQAAVTLSYNHKIDRRIAQYTDGDDLEDLGRHSKEFEVVTRVELQEFLAFEKELEAGQPTFKSPLGTFKVVVKTIEFHDDGRLRLLLVEDLA